MELKEFLDGVPKARRAVARQTWRLRAGETEGTQALDRARRQLEEREKELERFLSRLSDPRYRAVLALRYGDGLRWRQVQERMEELGLYYSDRQIYHFHRRAMEEARRLWKNGAPE